MGGFSSVVGEETIMFANNVSFDGTKRDGAVTTNAQFLIGASIAPHVRVGTLASAGNTITFTYSEPTALTNKLNLEAGPAVPTSIVTDNGTATPVANSVNLLGRSGSKVGASGATITVRSPPYANVAGSTSVTLNSGSFATGAITLTTPVTAGLLDGDLLEFVATNGVLVIQLAATQVAHIGTLATSVAGTMTGTNTGDALCLRYQASTNDWWATSVIGRWVMA